MTGNPNLFAYLMMLMWVPIGIVVGRRMPGAKGFLVVFLGGTLLLPEQLVLDLKPPLFPPVTKHVISLFAAVIGCLPPPPKRSVVPGWAIPTLITLQLVGGVLTAVTNRYALVAGPRVIQPMTIYDGVALAVSGMVLVTLPFYLGMRYFRTIDDLRFLLYAIAFAALLYVPFVLLEARLSPVVHRWVYGYFQHDWRQAKRAGGFRAFVLMEHGLAVAFLYAQAVVVMLSIWRFKTIEVTAGVRKAFYILLPISLVACKSLGAAVYGVVASLLFILGGPGSIGRVAKYLALLALCFPLIRFNGWFPMDKLLEYFTGLDADRAGSLAFRFANEERLLEHSSAKYLFGWGGWGRGRVYDEITGENITVVDGAWIIYLSGRGLIGFLTDFGALTLPVLGAVKKIGSLVGSDQAVLATSAFLASLAAVELLPNGLFHLLPYVVAGALASVSSGLAARGVHAAVAVPAR